MNQLKNTIRRMLSHVFVRSGLTAGGRRLFPKRGALVLYGHRVSSDDEGFLEGLRPEWLEEQLAYLTRHFEVVSLSTLVRCFEERTPFPERAVVITLDDGFRDNLENALPLFEHYGVPATIFLVTGSVSSGQLPWSQRLGVLFQKTRARELAHSITGGARLPLGDEIVRHATYRKVKTHMASMTREDREQALTELSSLLEVEPPIDRMLGWDEVRHMMARGIEFGAHTFSHPMLARIPEDEARWEMERSREDLREMLGIERPFFCFPAGSLNSALVRRVRQLGFRSVFLPDRHSRMNTLGNADQFSMRRVFLPNGPGVELEAELDGPFHTVRRLYRPRAGARVESGA